MFATFLNPALFQIYSEYSETYNSFFSILLSCVSVTATLLTINYWLLGPDN